MPLRTSDLTSDAEAARSAQKFLQRTDLGEETLARGSSVSEESSFLDPIVQHALKSVSAFMQAKHLTGYVPGYNAQSSEILGVLKQMVEQMQDDLKQEQQTEAEAAKTFIDLRTAKMSELTAAMSQLDTKEDEIAKAQMDLANAEEELDRLQKLLSEYQVYMKELLKTCDEAEANFQLRKKARMAEIKAVSEAIGILTEDDARDSFSNTYKGASASFLQMSKTQSQARRQAAALLLREGTRSQNPELAALATSVELD
jgi:predicted RNase H-like nuclease (RuvC/YqgF family)